MKIQTTRIALSSESACQWLGDSYDGTLCPSYQVGAVCTPPGDHRAVLSPSHRRKVQIDFEIIQIFSMVIKSGSPHPPRHNFGCFVVA